ncbi:efflux RND transporter periplasmic adaptor subunit [Candidatus Nomurabacteria bacterium]|jgi:RND family efflux transporter MFP subunit|nr:MAG: efflux RND transporter periplasmic adaptor subunit [Candidatus Nomurabacteria bacterium]
MNMQPPGFRAKTIDFFKRLYARKRVFWGIVVVIVVVLVVLLTGGKKTTLATEIITPRDLQRTVLTSGTVTSTTDLTLSFQKQGIISEIKTNVGDMVKAGQVLAILEAGQEAAAVTEAEGRLLEAKANYAKVLSINQDKDIKLAEAVLQTAINDLENTKVAQDVLVANAKRTLYSSDLEAVPATGSTTDTAPTITGSYMSDEVGGYTVTVYSSSSASGGAFSISGLENNYSVAISTGSSVPLGSRGLFIQFPTDFKTGAVWIIEVPNTRSVSYATNYNAYQLALSTHDQVISSKEGAVNEKQAALDLKKAQASASDIQVANAQVVVAVGALERAQADLADAEIIAPADGTITKIDAKLGAPVQPFENMITLEDVANLYVDANVNEANILDIAPGEAVELAFASNGETKLLGTVADVDIAPTLISGVVNYKVVIELIEPGENIRPGLTADMTIITSKKVAVLAIPLRALIERDGAYYVLVATDEKGKKTTEQLVTIGEHFDGALVEIVTGLQSGDRIITNPPLI